MSNSDSTAQNSFHRDSSGVSRRSFIQSLGLSAAAGAIQSAAEAGATTNDSGILGPGASMVTLTVNSHRYDITIEPSTTLLEALRSDCELIGSKEICDRGSCGGCSVLVDGMLVASCMMLAVDAVGSSITTVEGLGSEGRLDPMQEAFIRHDALQCGYCTPGLLMACKALIASNPTPSLDEIKRGLSGNICRCGTYTNIFNAVLDATGQQPVIDRE